MIARAVDACKMLGGSFLGLPFALPAALSFACDFSPLCGSLRLSVRLLGFGWTSIACALILLFTGLLCGSFGLLGSGYYRLWAFALGLHKNF